jgi:hypothetical protein
MLGPMANDTHGQVDRPAPGHYQRRLGTVLSRQPLAGVTRDPQPTDRLRAGMRPRRRSVRRCRQMALPLDPA